MSRTIRIVAVSASALLGAALASPAAADPPTRTFRVTVTNVTSGQPLTPPVVATHRGAHRAFAVGQPASEGIQQIAENGNAGPLLAALGAAKHVSGVVHTSTGPLVPEGLPGSAEFDDSVAFTIAADPGANRLTFVSMLICTNDGFTGVAGLKLPNRVGTSVEMDTFAYDAGTEINTEDFADIVPPCQGLAGVSSDDPGTGTTDPALAEGGVIHHHQGIVGIADLLPEVHGWDPSAPVARIVVERIA